MSHRVNVLRDRVVLPDGNVYNTGDTPVLTDDQYERVAQSAFDSGTVSDGGAVGSGGAVTSVNGQGGDVVITKADLGLGNVNNTSDANKPVSTAQAAADATTLSTATGRAVTFALIFGD